MKIWSRLLRRKGVESQEVELLWIHRNRSRGGLLRTQNEVELRIRIEALQFCVARLRRKAIHWRLHKAIFEGLCNCDAFLDDRAGECHPWRGRADAHYGAVAISHSRYHVLNREVSLVVVTGLRSDRGNRAGELSVLRIIRIGNHLHRRHHVNRKIEVVASVTGSVTFALFTRAPLCVLRLPLRLTRPSGPRTTPGMRGSKLSKRSFALGASRNVFSEIVSEGAESLVSAGSGVTTTEVVTWMGFSSRGRRTSFSSTCTVRRAFRPGKTTSTV